MLRGVSRQIIEVGETGSPYFERALLFVRAPYTDRSDDLLHDKGKEWLERAGSYSGMRRARRRSRLHGVLCSLAGGAAGLLCGALLLR